MNKYNINLKLFGLGLAILVPLAEFNLIHNPIILWSIYVIFVVGVIIDFIINSPSRYKEASDLIGRVLDEFSLSLGKGEFNIRISVFMRASRFLWNRDGKLAIKFSSNNMVDAEDKSIKLDKWQGLTGHVWGIGMAYSAILSGIPDSELAERWKLTSYQINITSKVKAIAAYPIKSSSETHSIIGILSFDSTDNIGNYFENDHFKAEAGKCVEIISRLMHLFNLDEPLD